ncbi:MAG: hypothetical protein IK104_01350 [Clostridia bacterium]|nr:hypothetical protein [Clostridia bacterium]
MDIKKKRLIICLVIVGISLLIGILVFSRYNAPPRGMSENAYELGQNAVAVTNDYLNGIIDEKTAISKLQTIKSRIEKDDDGSNWRDEFVAFRVDAISWAIDKIQSKYNTGTTADVNKKLRSLQDFLKGK